MRVIAVANQKGGVGKTTTACNIAAGLAIRGYRTLLIDLDSQCNATVTYLPREVIKETLANVLVSSDQRLPLSDAIYNTHLEGLDIAPSHIRLAIMERLSSIEDQYRLKMALKTVEDDYDVVIIDCPPSLGMTLTAALLSATHVIIPVAAQFYPLEGVVDLADTIVATKMPNPGLQILGYLLTDFDMRINICGEALSKMQEMFPGLVFETVIRTNAKLQTAPSVRKSIYEHAPQSHGATDYSSLTDEVIERLNLSGTLRIVKEA